MGECSALVVTASLDRSCKVHRMSDGKLLRTIAFPVSIHSVVMDAGEHCLYAGGGDGAVFEVALAGAVAGTGGGSGGQTKPVYIRMEGHSRAVNSLAVSVDGENLVSGESRLKGLGRRWGASPWVGW